MIFKKLQVYKLTKELEPVTAEALESNRFKGLEANDMVRTGLASPVFPLNDDAPLFLSVGDDLLFCARTEERQIPNSVIRDMVNDRVKEIEKAEGRTPFRKEKQLIKESVINELMPRAFIKRTLSWFYFNKALDCIIVGDSSVKAENCLALLRKSLGTLGVAPISPKNTPAVEFTEWFKSSVPGDSFTLLDKITFSSTLRDGQVKLNDECGDGEAETLTSDRLATKVKLSHELMTFEVDEGLSFSSVKPTDIYFDADEGESETFEQQQEIDLAIMAGAHTKIINSLIEALGGLEE